MDKLKFNSSVIKHTSNPFHVALHSLKGVFNLRQFHMQSVDSFYKHFYSSVATCKLMGCDATSFTGLEKHDDDTKDSSQHMDAVCLIKTYEPQRF